MRVGVNYTPRRGWFHSWLDLDEREVAADFKTLAALGLDHVRIFPLWPLLQPSRTMVNQRAVDDVVRVVQLAQDNGLQVSVDVLNGHLSSFDFVPSWVTSWHQRNLFADPEVVQAQALLVGELAGALSHEPGATGVCLGNEFAQFAAPRHPQQSRISERQAADWLRTLLAAARRAWPEGDHVHSFDDDIWFVDEHPFTPQHAVELGDLTTVHSWVFVAAGPRFGAGHPALPAFARYLCDLANAWAPEPGRRLWLQELGAPITHVPAGQAARFLADTMVALLGTPNLEAVTWWCSHDVDRSLGDFPELEYSLGLVDSEGRVKPAGHQLAELVPEMQISPASEPVGGPVVDFVGDPARRSLTSSTGAVFDEWLALHLAGERPVLRRVAG
ncbi:hypothetical protein [Luteococcus peritonei]|uniref:Glycosyl hydrolase n=1 Tax=Luteococcus peritonei TaxID=88874 RepID=A0ABW4RVI1_9ACTN